MPGRIVPLVLVLLLLAEPALPQSAERRLTGVVSTNPLGFLQLGPNLEYEFAANDAHGLGAGIRLPTLGLYTHLLNEDIQSGWTVYGVWHVYPRASRLRGWYVGPHLELGRTDNETYRSNVLGGGGEFGYRWVRRNGFAIVLGGLLGMLRSSDEWKDGSGSAGDETWFIWMLNVSLGAAR